MLLEKGYEIDVDRVMSMPGGMPFSEINSREGARLGRSEPIAQSVIRASSFLKKEIWQRSAGIIAVKRHMFAHSGALRFTAVLCSVLVSSGELPLIGQQNPPAATTTEATPKIPADQLDSLVAPIAVCCRLRCWRRLLPASRVPLESSSSAVVGEE